MWRGGEKRKKGKKGKKDRKQGANGKTIGRMCRVPLFAVRLAFSTCLDFCFSIHNVAIKSN